MQEDGAALMEQVDEANVGVLDERVSGRGYWCLYAVVHIDRIVDGTFGPTKKF